MSNNANEKKYLQFLDLFKKANSSLDKQKQYKQAQELWNFVKNDGDLYEKKMNELRSKAAKSKGSLMSFWGTALSSPPQKKKKTSTTVVDFSKTPSVTSPCSKETEVIELGKMTFILIK